MDKEDEVVAISSLDPSDPVPSDTVITALVSLLWPYSSTTGQCALLLADPDFRKRYRKGQVRVRFSGPSARAIAKSKISIGDQVDIRLDGARWINPAHDGPLVQTPGKGVEGELIFGTSLKLNIRKDGQQERHLLDVNEPADAPSSQSFTNALPSTPAARFSRHSGFGMDAFGVAVYSSPAFMKRLRLSESSFVESPRTPLSEDADRFIGSAKSSRRASYKHVTEWKFDKREPSPEKQAGEAEFESSNTAVEDVVPHKEAAPESQEATEEAQSLPASTNALRNESNDVTMDTPASRTEDEQTSDGLGAGVGRPARGEDQEMYDEYHEAAQSSTTATTVPSMPPPSLPRLQMPTIPAHVYAENMFAAAKAMTAAEENGPPTPRLRPIGNQNLPLPSPFPTSAKELVPPIESFVEQHMTLNTTSDENVATARDEATGANEKAAESIEHRHESSLAQLMAEKSDTRQHSTFISEHVQVFEIEDMGSDDDQNIERVLGILEKSMTPFSHTDRSEVDAFSVVDMEDELDQEHEESEGRSTQPAAEEMRKGETEEGDLKSETAEQLAGDHPDGKRETGKAPVETPVAPSNARQHSTPQPTRVVYDTFRGMGHVPSPPVVIREAANTEAATSPSHAREDVEMGDVDPRTAESQDPDALSETGYDDDMLASLQASDDEMEEPDLDFLTDDLRDEIDAEDLKALLGGQSGEEDNEVDSVDDGDVLVHDSVCSSEDDDDLEDPLMEPSDDESEAEEDDSREEDVEVERWGLGDSDTGTPVPQSGPAVISREVVPEYGLDGAGLSKESNGASNAAPETSAKTPVAEKEEEEEEEEEEAAWEAREAALREVDSEQLPSLLSHASTMPLSSVVAEKPLPQRRSGVTIVEIPSDSEDSEDEQDLQHNVAHDDTAVNDSSSGVKNEESDGRMRNEVVSENDEGPEPEKVQVSVNDTSGTSDRISADQDMPDLTSSQYLSSGPVEQYASDKTDSYMTHPGGLALLLDGDDSSSLQKPNPPLSGLDAGTADVPSSHLSDVTAGHTENLLVSRDDPGQGKEFEESTNIDMLRKGEPEGSQTLDLPRTDLVAAILEPAQDLLQQDAENMRLTNSSFVTLSSPSPGPHESSERAESIEAIDLSQVEPDFMTTPSLSQSERVPRTEPVPDSTGSPATILVAGSRGAVTRTSTPVGNGNETLHIPLSQDVGLSQMQGLRDGGQTTTGKKHMSQRTEVESEEPGVDEELLVEYVRGNDDLVKNLAPVTEPSGAHTAQEHAVKSDVNSGVPSSRVESTELHLASHTSLVSANTSAVATVQETVEGEQIVHAHVGASESEAATQVRLQADNSTSHSNAKSLASRDSPATPNAHTPTAFRRSLQGKMSSVPSVISAWFTPRRSSGVMNSPHEESKVGTPAPKRPAATPNTREKRAERQVSPPPELASQGTSTSLSYFHPLASVEAFLNQSTYTADVIAVSTGVSSEAIRADKGPRDFFTVLQLTDPSLHERKQAVYDNEESSTDATKTEMRAEVFRPWKASLPTTEEGDVVLLRNFVVKSFERRSYLLSSEASSWCVWRFSATITQQQRGEDHQDIFQPAWVRKQHTTIKEQVKGPPMDIGPEEREKARHLRRWWEREMRTERSGGRDSGQG
ncbi:hypothetical protein AAFC00_006315 [Neodothiora populina]|uniref:Telomeric single stranded DNA binding POT1/Cdc13 domain-containing protein n=1 Tax=Neodothiora populina TaxID=2781224 RepID=A0ABR3P4S9_9PEZI